MNLCCPVFQSHPVAVKLLNFPMGINKGPSYLILFYRSMLSINDMSHNASHFVTWALKRLAIICPRLLFSDVVNYEVITLSNTNPMQRQSYNIIHYFIYIMYLYMYIYIVTTGPLSATIMLMWPMMKLSLTPLPCLMSQLKPPFYF